MVQPGTVSGGQDYSELTTEEPTISAERQSEMDEKSSKQAINNTNR